MLTYDDIVVRSEQKEDLTLGASGHGASDASGLGLGTLDALWK
jgi:hypothetical protein